MSRQWWRRLAWMPGLLVLLALISVVSHRGEEERLLALIEHSRPAWLLAAAVLQVATYFCAAAVWQRVLREESIRQPLSVLAPLAVARLFTDQVFPSGGFGGRFLVVRALQRRGVGLPAAMAAILVDLITFYLTFSTLVGFTLAILWRRHDLNGMILSVVTAFSLMAAGVPVGALWLSRGGKMPHWTQRLPRVGKFLGQIASAPRSLVRNRAVLLQSSALQLLIFLLDSATLWMMLRAVGSHTGPGEVFASFIIASVAMTVILTPGGLGTFESACVAMLALFHVPAETALAATLLLRGFTYWLPMLPGVWVSRREMRPQTATVDSRPAEPSAGSA